VCLPEELTRRTVDSDEGADWKTLPDLLSRGDLRSNQSHSGWWHPWLWPRFSPGQVSVVFPQLHMSC